MNFVVFQCNMIFVNSIPLLYSQLFRSGAELSSRQLLEVSNRVVLIAFHSDFLAQSIIQHNFNHILDRVDKGEAVDRVAAALQRDANVTTPEIELARSPKPKADHRSIKQKMSDEG